ncbi:hypothetical protein G6F56_006366 [Rhizopus delemar]|uniref:Uncharacterized protein n=1 Tax=Rhizopus stolonifer TaxID=4846 RepID=A0A367KSA6_RHIST|nr:hypothetical protein G6F56_006366 [Rhizopus delemar]RCI05071.1 hypothetical protein CU098_008017 [Rhizopus stolonifer]
MKFTHLIPAFFLCFHAVYGKLDISLPDADSQWTTGSEETVVWSSSATEFGLLCKIQLIDAKTEQVVYNITNTTAPCSINTLKTDPIPKFEHEIFMIRIFETSNTTVSVYTQDFKISN